MPSIAITLGQDKAIDCGKLCHQIQHLIVNESNGPGEKLLYISIKDIIDLPDPLPKIEDRSHCTS